MKQFQPKIILALILGVVLTNYSCTSLFPNTEPETPSTQHSSEYVFTSDENGKYEIWIHHQDSLKLLISSENKDCWWPKVNPDKRLILYYESNQSRNVNDYQSATLMLMNLIDSNKRELIVLGQDNQFAQQGLANWANQSEKIIFSAQDLNLKTWQIYQLDLIDNLITKISKDNSRNYLDPIYSLDDKLIYCVSSPDSGSNDSLSEIYRLDIISGEETRLTFNNRRDHHPNLNTDGSKLVYESLTDPDYLTIGKWDIMELDLSSNEEKLLFEDAGIRFFPEYSSDGSILFFTELRIETATLTIGGLFIETNQILMLESNGVNAMNVSPF